MKKKALFANFAIVWVSHIFAKWSRTTVSQMQGHPTERIHLACYLVPGKQVIKHNKVWKNAANVFMPYSLPFFRTTKGLHWPRINKKEIWEIDFSPSYLALENAMLEKSW